MTLKGVWDGKGYQGAMGPFARRISPFRYLGPSSPLECANEEGVQYLRLLRHYHLFKRTVRIEVPVPSFKCRAFPLPSAFQSSKDVPVFNSETEAGGHLSCPGKLSDA